MKLRKNKWWGFYNETFTKYYQFRGTKLMWIIG